LFKEHSLIIIHFLSAFMYNRSALSLVVVQLPIWMLLLISNLIPQMGRGQNPEDTILADKINLALIEQLVLQRIDTLRVSKGLTALSVDTSLTKAAIDHAQWLVKQRSISHRQPVPAKATVQRRAAFYGGTEFLCGENIAASFIIELMADGNGKRYRNITYNDIANEFVRLWVQSSGHYANIINPVYSYTGLAVSYHPKTRRVVAVQVFGYLPPAAGNP
jgi:uncharacterized protein YkwD